MSMKIKKGDKVKVISGKDKGKIAVVLKALTESNKIVVEGVGIVKKQVKPGTISKEGGIISIEKPIDVSNVMYICKNCGKTVRIGYRLEGDIKLRYCKKCKSPA